MRMTGAPTPALSVEPGANLTRYVDDVRRVLRQTSPTDFESWRAAYDGGITAAYKLRDIDGLLAIATFGAACLDAQGFHEEALAQLTYAVEMASDEANAAAYLLSARGVFESIMGRYQQAAASIAAAREHLPGVTDVRARIAFATYEAIVRCVRLDATERSVLTAPIPDAERHGFDWFSSALKCWLICYLFALGEWKAALPWIESLRLQADAADHPARKVDASVLQSGANAIVGAAIADSEPEARRTLNYIALWRLTVLQFRQSLLSGDWSGAERQIAVLDEISKIINPGFTDGAGAFVELLIAYRGGTSSREMQPPSRFSVMNVGAALAGLEVVAIAGSQAEAAGWLAWVTEHVPAHVRTSLEWPVPVDRVIGLLRVRAGDLKGGIAALRRAIQWCDTAGYEIEAKIARLQLAEVLEHSATAGRRRDIVELRAASWASLNAQGIDSTRQAYAATRAIALSQDITQPRLTRREVEVLALLGKGMTYKAVALPLGISWRTVQLHAHRAYTKLGATGRHQAIELAREQQIL